MQSSSLKRCTLEPLTVAVFTCRSYLVHLEWHRHAAYLPDHKEMHEGRKMIENRASKETRKGQWKTFLKPPHLSVGRLPVRLALCQGGTWCPGDVGARVTKQAASTETDEQHVALRGASISSNYGDTATEVKGPFLPPCGCLSLSSTISVPVYLVPCLSERLRPASALLTMTMNWGAIFYTKLRSRLIKSVASYFEEMMCELLLSFWKSTITSISTSIIEITDVINLLSGLHYFCIAL